MSILFVALGTVDPILATVLDYYDARAGRLRTRRHEDQGVDGTGGPPIKSVLGT